MEQPTTAPEDHKYDKHAVEHARRVLMEAEEIKGDEKMMGLIGDHHAKEKTVINSLGKLKKKAKEVIEEED